MSTYFDGQGEKYTEAAVKEAVARARELDIHEYVISSGRGPSAWALINELGGNGEEVRVVTHACGFKEPFVTMMEAEERKKLGETGAVVVTATHALSGIERWFTNKYQGTYPALIIADTLKLFGQGMKVAVECAIMAADAGVLSGKRIVSFGGTSRGVDTAIVMTPGHAAKALDQIKIHEIICKPGLH